VVLIRELENAFGSNRYCDPWRKRLLEDGKAPCTKKTLVNRFVGASRSPGKQPRGQLANVASQMKLDHAGLLSGEIVSSPSSEERRSRARYRPTL